MIRAEFSRPHRLTPEHRHLDLAATAEERAALAARFGIPAIGALTAALDLAPEPGGVLRVRGRLRAEVTQECVATLDPVDQVVDAPLDLRLLPPGTPPTDDDPDSPDEIETADGTVDLGEAVEEQLALALDPFPRRPDVAMPEPVGHEAETRPNPFAALARLKRG